MGNLSQYNDPHAWRVEKQFPFFQLLTNNEGKQVERYFVSSAEYSQLRLRITAPSTWVQILECNNKENIHYIIVQRIKRLSQVKEISFTHAVQIFKDVLKTYVSLEKVYGRFQVTNKMIGFSHKNEVKMWIHQNFGVNRPMKPVSFKDKEITSQILKIIGDLLKTRKDQFLKIFQSKQNDTSFNKTIILIQTFQKSSKINSKISLNKLNSKRSPLTTRDNKQKINRVNTETASPLKRISNTPHLFLRKPSVNLIVSVPKIQVSTPIKINSPLNSPRYSSKRQSIQNNIIFQHESQYLYSVNSYQDKKRAQSPDYSTNMTLNTQKQMLKQISVADSLKRIRSESSFVNKIQLFEEADFNGSFGRKLKGKTFPTNLPIAISLDQVPSRETIVVEQSTVIRGGEQYSTSFNRD